MVVTNQPTAPARHFGLILMNPTKRVQIPVPAEIQKLLDDGKIDAVEEAWLEKAQKAPADLDYFTSVAAAVAKADSQETANILLQMLDDALVDAGHWTIRIELLRRCGRAILPAPELHEAIVDCLEKVYGEHTHYEEMLDKVGLQRATEDIPKTWQKTDRFESLMAFDVGTIVRMKDKGAGRILEVNMALGSFNVALDDGLEIRVGFGGAAKLLDALPPGHVLRRKLEDPESLKQLPPAELLRLVLEGEGKALTGAEIKKILSGVVTPKKWNSWWTAARKHPQAMVDPKNKRAYIWAASSEDAQDAVWGAFQKAKPAEQLVMLRRDAERDDALKKRMSVALWQQASKVTRKHPGLACEIWFNLERSGVTPPSDAEWIPEKVLKSTDHPNAVLAGIQERMMREKAYAVVRKIRPDWVEVFAQALMRETDAKLLDMLSDSVFGMESERFGPFFDQLVSQPRKAPAVFTWLVERAADKPEWMKRNPLRLMQQLLFANTHEDFAPFRAARLAPLLESGGTLPRLLDHLTLEQATSALETVKKSPGLEEYHREPLLNAIQLRFPDLHKSAEQPLYATEGSIREKRAELKNLAEVELPENRVAIESARELGDLRENFEYHAARRRHEYLSDRAGKLDNDLRRVRQIDPSNVDGSEVIIGAIIKFKNDSAEVSYTLLGPWESNPEENVLSNESDLGKRLLGLKPGAEVELPDGTFNIEAIEPWSA